MLVTMSVTMSVIIFKKRKIMNDIKKFLRTYGGAIIGALIAILILCTRLYELIIWIVFICLGIYIGNYVQHNKTEVKDKLKNFIDRL